MLVRRGAALPLVAAHLPATLAGQPHMRALTRPVLADAPPLLTIVKHEIGPQ